MKECIFKIFAHDDDFLHFIVYFYTNDIQSLNEQINQVKIDKLPSKFDSHAQYLPSHSDNTMET